MVLALWWPMLCHFYCAKELLIGSFLLGVGLIVLKDDYEGLALGSVYAYVCQFLTKLSVSFVALYGLSRNSIFRLVFVAGVMSLGYLRFNMIG